VRQKLILLALLVFMVVGVAGPAYAYAIIDLSASVDQNTRQVSIHGVIDTGAGQPVTIKITAPSGSLEYLGQVTSTSGGDFSVSYTLSSMTQGVYLAEASGNPNVTKLQTYFRYGTAGDVTSTAVTQTNVTISADGSNKKISITPATVALNTPITITIPSGVMDATMNVSGLFNPIAGATPSTSAMPAINVISNTTISSQPARMQMAACNKKKNPLPGSWRTGVRAIRLLSSN